MKKQFIIPNEVMFESKLSASAKVLYAMLLNYKKEASDIPSYDILAKEMNVSSMTVRNLVKELQEREILDIKKSGRKNIYYLMVE